MIIKSIRWAVHRQPIKDRGWALVTGEIASVDCVIVTLVADDGIRGFGSICGLMPFDPPVGATEAALREFAPFVVGRPVGDIISIAATLERTLHGFGTVKAGIEMALHDLVARRDRRSIAASLGGAVQSHISVSRIVPLRSPQAMADYAATLAERGYSTLKVKLGGEETLDAIRVEAVRARVGSGIALTVDANGRYETKAALRLIRRIEPLDIVLFEQPVAPADREGLALITRSAAMIIEADESAATLADIASLLRGCCVDSVNLRISNLGGIRPTLRAIDLCRSAGVGWRFGACFLPSHYQAVSAQIAALHLPPSVAHELAEHELFCDDPFEPLLVEDGCIAVPSGHGAGLGPRLPLGDGQGS